MVGALLVALMAQVGPVARTPDLVPLRVRVYAERGVDRSTVERSHDVARRLFSSAGIDLVWRLCEPLAVCDPGTRPPWEVPIIISAEAPRKPANCGRSVVGTLAGPGVVRVSVPCVAEVAARLAIAGGSRWGRVHPLLKLETYDDVLGAVVAHELGHVLGVKHGPGVMSARFDTDDILSLRLGVLVFTASQGARMRQLLAEPTGEELAGGRQR